MSTETFTGQDVAQAIELVTTAFVTELKEYLDPLSVLEVTLKVCRNLEAQVKAADG